MPSAERNRSLRFAAGAQFSQSTQDEQRQGKRKASAHTDKNYEPGGLERLFYPGARFTEIRWKSVQEETSRRAALPVQCPEALTALCSNTTSWQILVSSRHAMGTSPPLAQHSTRVATLGRYGSRVWQGCGA